MALIKLTRVLVSGETSPMLVNTNQAQLFIPAHNGGTKVFFPYNAFQSDFVVKESIDEIMAMLEH